MSMRRIFVAMALVLVLAPLAANAPLFDPDEGLHAAIAQEMVLRGDYVTPTFLGEPFLDKPILFFWAEALSLRVLGHYEAAVRLPPLLFGVLGMVGVAALGRVLFDEPTGLVAGIVYGTMLVPLGVSEVAVHDVGVAGFMCGACALLVHSVTSAARFRLKAEATEERLVASAFRRNVAFAGIALGLSILTKGLVGLVFAGLLAVCLVVQDRTRLVRLAAFLAIAGAIAVLVAVPWYIAMERAHPGYLHYYFVERHLQGYLTATQRHAGRAWWYYLPIVVGGALPWTGYLVTAVRHARASRTRLVVWGWFVLGLAFLSAGESKLVTYALPLFPALAILAADAIVSAGGFVQRPGYAVYASSLAVLPAVAAGIISWRYDDVGVPYWFVTAAIGVAIAVVAVWIRTRGTLSAAPLWLPVMALCGLMILLPRGAAWMTGRDLAVTLNAGGALPPHVSVLDERIGSLVFYLSPSLRAAATPNRIDQASLAEAISRIRVSHPDAVIAVRHDRLARFNRLFASPPPPDARAGTFDVFRAATLQQALTIR